MISFILEINKLQNLDLIRFRARRERNFHAHVLKGFMEKIVRRLHVTASNVKTGQNASWMVHHLNVAVKKDFWDNCAKEWLEKFQKNV